jgi:AcrR family transcriptional regulator
MGNVGADAARGRARPTEADNSARDRVLRSAFGLFCERGYSRTSMLDIATRAKVSKRDLYALFDNKSALLAEGIGERARSMRRSLGSMMPVPSTKQALAAALVEVGGSILQAVCHPEVLMIYRLAIAESDQSPEFARVLDSNGREANRRALAEFLKKAQIQSLLGPGDPTELATRYATVLWGDLLVPLLLRIREAPGAKEIETRARAATEAVIRR